MTGRDAMPREPDLGRRRFPGRVAMTLAAMRFGLLGTAAANEREPRHLAAFRNATAWLNSPPLSATTLAGKVVLVQFGTYSCINWLRSFRMFARGPKKYRQGLVVIGVHTPEFGFEKKPDNVRRAAQEMKLDYPDRDGQRLCDLARLQQSLLARALLCSMRAERLRRHHFGEGEYEQSEIAIQQLLAQKQVSKRYRRGCGVSPRERL